MSSNSIYSIYLITNLTNNKKYIGYTSNKQGHRFKDHCSTKNPKYQDRSAISLAIEKYGKENFLCEVIFQSKDYEYCRHIETDFIIQYNSLTDTQNGWGYNIDKGGKGHKRSPETIEKHRQKIKGRLQSEEHKSKKGFKLGNDAGKFNKGKTRTEEQNKAQSELRKQEFANGKKPPMTGKSFKEDYPKSLEKMKQTKRNNRIIKNKYKNILIQFYDNNTVLLDENYVDWFKQHSLNNFMSKQTKNNSEPIKGWRLVSYELND
jgi:group I intron endonuclease